MKINTASRNTALACCLAVSGGLAADPAPQGRAVTMSSSQQPAGLLDLSLRNEVDAAVLRGLDWLAARQHPDGSWSDPNMPALTALALKPFIRTPHPERRAVIERSVAFLLSCRQPDGGIYREKRHRRGGGLSGYNTAICMTVLHAVDKDRFRDTILAARRFVADTQPFGQHVPDAEFAYNRDLRRAYIDLLNTYYIVESMRLTEDIEASRTAGSPAADIDWQAVIEHIERMAQTETAEDAGRVRVPAPGSGPGDETNVVFRAYGSMTYAGLMALIYAEVTPRDPRVRSALDWSAKYWSLSENPGMGQQGLYFFYHALTRALTASGIDLIRTPQQTFVNWRQELAARLVSLQRIDPRTGHGYWENPEARFWEGDPVLVTAYSLQVLQGL